MKNWKTTLGGLLLALATAWATIDFTTFVWSKDWAKLILPGIVAIGGFLLKDPQKKSLNKKASEKY